MLTIVILSLLVAFLMSRYSKSYWTADAVGPLWEICFNFWSIEVYFTFYLYAWFLKERARMTNVYDQGVSVAFGLFDVSVFRSYEWSKWIGGKRWWYR